VMGHIGLTPQSVNQLGGYRVQGRTSEAARELIDDAVAIEEAGAFSIVLELVPGQVAAAISERLEIPTIGIGAGPHCDGQVQVFHDLLGIDPDFHPRHARRYAELGETIRSAVSEYVADVKSASFPTDTQTISMSPEEEARLRELLGDAPASAQFG